MSEEDADQELEAIHKQVGGWFDGFITSPQYEPLTQTQKERAPDIVRCFAEYSFTHVGLAPERWDRSGLSECCVEVLPRKMSSEPAFFQAMAPVLSAFFTFLAEQGLLNNARALAKTVVGLDAEIVAASQDKSHWGLAKRFVMAGVEAGIDFNDQQAVNQFMAVYNLQFQTPPDPAPPESLVPTTPASLPPPWTTVRRSEPKIGRNDPCPCGSGKKFKKCCGGGSGRASAD